MLLLTCLEDRIHVRKAPTKSPFPILPALSFSLREVHWAALKFAERQFWMDLVDNVAEFRAKPQKLIDLSDLGHDGEGLLADCLAREPLALESEHASSKQRASSTERTGVGKTLLPRFGRSRLRASMSQSRPPVWYASRSPIGTSTATMSSFAPRSTISDRAVTFRTFRRPSSLTQRPNRRGYHRHQRHWSRIISTALSESSQERARTKSTELSAKHCASYRGRLAKDGGTDNL